MQTMSKLQKACLDTIAKLEGDEQGWIDRAAFDEKLNEDAWVKNNTHRLARLDFTLAGLSTQGVLALKLGFVRDNRK